MDQTLKDLMKAVNPDLEEKLFGSKVVVFGDDFWQILPVTNLILTLSNDASNARDKTYCDSMKTFLHVTKSLLYLLCKCKATGKNF